MQWDNNQLLHSMWIFTGGAILVLLQSILSNAKRNWWALLAGCAVGGAGSWVAAQIWGDSKYIYLICGAAAVMTENLLLGAVKASKQFAEDPIMIAKTLIPFFNKGANVTINEEKEDK
jgi:hypothetical protein